MAETIAQVRTAIRPGIKAMAERIIAAEDNFTETLMALGGISKPTAAKVCQFYLKNKLAKVDAVMGRINVKHGAFLDARAIQRAAELVNAK